MFCSVITYYFYAISICRSKKNVLLQSFNLLFFFNFWAVCLQFQFEPPSSRWPNKSSISRNGNWSCLKCIAITQTSKKRSRSLFKPFGRKWNQIWSLWQKKRPIMERYAWCTGVVHFYNEMSYSCGRNSCYLVLELNCHGTQSPGMKKVYYMGK